MTTPSYSDLIRLGEGSGFEIIKVCTFNCGRVAAGDMTVSHEGEPITLPVCEPCVTELARRRKENGLDSQV